MGRHLHIDTRLCLCVPGQFAPLRHAVVGRPPFSGPVLESGVAGAPGVVTISARCIIGQTLHEPQ